MTARRTPAERLAHHCAICIPDADTDLETGTDHRTEDHDDA